MMIKNIIKILPFNLIWKSRWLNLALVFASMLFILPDAFATHIIGGELTYRCLGNDQYEITLIVYRDCETGNPEAIFDDPAVVGIFDSRRNQLQTNLGFLGMILLKSPDIDLVSVGTDCDLGGESVCIERGTYKAIVDLPFLEGGYQLAYQRCCRNTTLFNIIEPTETGATFTTIINDRALLECNSAPEFREWPPIYICVNEAINYDHSATDPDGDSLVYSLCTPNLGATRSHPIPQPPGSPPYEPVIWKAPYGLDNLLGGDDVLRIDQNGILSGTPNTLGQFLVGICVEEYREGELISTTRRDFEYNVIDCELLAIADFTIDTSVVCADVVDVSIFNAAKGMGGDTVVSYQVESDKGLSLTFNEPNPSFRVNGRQTLSITQTVSFGDLCKLTITKEILLDVDDTGIGASDTIVICEGSSIFLNPGFNDRYTYTWTPETYLEDPNHPNPLAEPLESILYTANVFDPVNNCSIEETIFVQVIPNPDVTVGFELDQICNTLRVQFNNTSTGAESFQWSFGDGSTSSERDPIHDYALSGVYDIVLTIPGDDCNSIRSKRMTIEGIQFGDFSDTIDFCGPSYVELNPGGDIAGYEYQWEAHPLIPDPTIANPQIFVEESTVFRVTVNTDPTVDSCVFNGEIIVNIGDQLVVDIDQCLFICEPGEIALNPDGDPNLIYSWEPTALLNDPTAANPTATIVDDSTQFFAKITDPDEASCMVTIPVLVKLGLDIGFEDGDTLYVCEGSSLFLNPDFNPNLTYVWTPAEGLDDPNHPNPIATPTDDIAYTATVTDTADCSVTGTIYIQVVTSDVFVDFDIEKECASTTLQFINTSVNATNFMWTFGDPENPGFVSTEKDPVYTYPASGTYDVQLTSADDADCVTSRARRITVAGEEFVDFEEEITVCGPSLVALNPDRNPNYIYMWEENPLIPDSSVPNPEVFIEANDTFVVIVNIQDPLNDTCIIQGVITVIVGDQLIVDIDRDLFLCEPGEIALNPNGNPDLIYRWEPANLLDDPNIANPTATIAEDSIRFIANITDPDDPSCMVRIPVLVNLGLDLGFEDGDTLIICDSSSFFLNPNFDPNLTYVWSPAEGLDDPNSPNPIASPESSIAYTATATDSTGCTDSGTIFIEIVDSEVLVDFEVEKECNSLTLQFINTSRNAVTFQWTFGDPDNPGFVSTDENPSYTYPRPGTYDVELRSGDDNSCTAIRAMRLAVAGDDFQDFNDTITICGPGDVSLNPDRNPDYIYAWKPHPDISDTTEANPMVTIDTSTLYSVTVTDPLNDTCIIEGTVFVLVEDRVSLPPKTIIECEPATVALNPGADSNFVYIWDPAALLDDPTSPNPMATVEQSTIFSVTITDPLDPECEIKTEVEVLIEDYVPLITSDPVDMACTGDTVTLSAQAELVDSIQWFDPNGNYLGGERSFQLPLETSGVYTVLGFKGACVFMDSIFLGIRMLEFEFNKDQPVCADEPIEIMIINATNFQIDSIVWSPDSIVSLGQGNETVVIRIDETMEINLEVYYEDGCMVEQSFTVEVSDIEDRFVAFADPDTIFFGETTTLNVTDEAGATYNWSPSQFVNDPTAPSTTAQVPETTTFTVDITDTNGCTTQKMVTVTVIIVNCEPPYLFMPNAFTPNGDGENDVLFVRGQYIESMDLYIYNRWGQLVFESHNPNNGWDGSYDGKELSPDVYGYSLQIECIGGGSYIEKGNVTILK